MEQENDTLIKLKQDLLKTEIIDKNYDKEKFLEYCITKKPSGDDLTSWTFEELKKAVDEFISIPENSLSYAKEKDIKKQEEMKKEITVDVEKIKIYVIFLIFNLLLPEFKK